MAFRKKETARSKANFQKAYPILRDEVYAAYGGYKCKCCGETEPLFLSIDHVGNDGYLERGNGPRRRKPNSLQRLKNIKTAGFPNTYQILCMNCNHGKHRNGGVCPHIRGPRL